MVPMPRLPHADAGQVMAQDAGSTPLFAGSKLTVAVIVEMPVAPTKRGFAERETAIAAKVNATDPDFVGSLSDLAVIVTCTSLGGGVEGAV